MTDAASAAKTTAKTTAKATATGKSRAEGAAPSAGRLYLVDGSGYIFRAYHALPRLNRSDGTPTGAVLGFCNMLSRLLDTALGRDGHDHVAVIFDSARQTFRNDIYDQYKANRPPPPDDLIPQFDLIREATRAFSVPAIEAEGFEADDIIATYARLGREAGYDVVIVSSDKDLMQLVGERVSMLDPIKDQSIGVPEVVEKFGVAPDKMVDLQALMGDSVDNVPGVPGIGPKTAAELLATYGDLETLLARAGEIKQPKRREALIANADRARMSRELVRLKEDVALDLAVGDLRLHEPDPEVLFPFLDEMEFTKLAERLRNRRGAAAPPPAAKPARPARAGRTVEPLFETVRDAAALARWIAEAETAGTVALAVHTRSEAGAHEDLVGLSVATAPGRACYIPLGHRQAAGELDLGAATPAAGDVRQLDRAAALAALAPLLAAPGVLKVGCNIKRSVIALARAGCTLTPVDDVIVLSHVLEAGLFSHGREALALRHAERRLAPYKELVGGGKAQLGFDEVEIDRAAAWACADVEATLSIHEVLRRRLVQDRLVTVYETLERPLIAVLAEMERAGIRVDPQILVDLSADFARRAADLEAEIHRLAGHPFNVGSPKQLGEVLFDEMGLAGGRKGKTGAYTTSADVLDELAAEGHRLPERVLEWRQVTKLKSTYTDALQQEINPQTGRVHTSYDQAGAATGRLASNDPNLQNIPVRTEEGRKIRRAFVADRGCKLLSADYSQIELRLLAHIADIDSLKTAFAEGIDIHALTASQVFGVPIAGMDPMVRRNAKAINFGIIYGMSAFGLARQLGIPRADAAAYIKAYFERYPGIQAYMERTKALCREHGYVETLFGRRCHIAGIRDRNPSVRNFSERAAINAPLQGSAADIIKRAMTRIPAALAAARLTGRMLLTVHDELLFEVPAGEADATGAVVRKVMEGAAHLSVPLTVEVGIGDNWDAAH